MDSNNYVAQLNLYMQSERAEVIYEDVDATGPDHIKTFVMRVTVNGVPCPDGVGKNKKEAKQNAAKNALEMLRQESVDSRMNVSEASVASVDHTPTKDYVSMLNVYGQDRRLSVNPIQSTRPDPNVPAQFCCKYKVGDTEYQEARGMTKKEAKQAAAKIAFDTLSSPNKTMSCEAAGRASPQSVGDVSEIQGRLMNLSLASEDESFVGTNYIGKLNEYCQRKRLHSKITEVQRRGLPHQPRFCYKVVIGDKEYLPGEGGNIKEAKQNAAQQAWNAISEQSDLDSKTSWTSSDVGSPFGSSTPVRSGDTTEPKHPAMMSTSGSFIVFKDSASSPQVKAPDVKPRRILAANFKNAVQKEATMERPDLRGKASNDNKQVISSFMSDFDSIERIGKGAFGRVYRAREKLVDRKFAIKIVKFKDKKTLIEVKALIDLSHKNIVRYYNCWIEDSLYQLDAPSSSCSSTSTDTAPKYLYIKMELCSDRTLRKWVDEKNAKNVKKPFEDPSRREESLSIAQQIIRGVEYFHSKQFIHRDLKPANIMFGQEGQVKIGDFGLVTEEIDDDSENERERALFKGTPIYMAPEQVSAYVCERKADIFSLGLIYFELFWSIFTVQERDKIWHDVRKQKFPSGFSQFFPTESKIISLMLSQTPVDRPDASEVKKRLKELHGELYPKETVSKERKTC
ncbi:interferon-induced, double-stranded RNA-activated protein kinase [Synchiropus picturatus]